MSFSIWTFLSSGGALIFTYADTILIGLFMTEADVGIYRVAFQLTSVASFIVLAFHTVLFPRISKWHTEKNFSLIEYSMGKAFTYSLFIAIPMTAGGIILSEKLLYYLYGASFVSGAPVLVILLFVQMANIFMFLLTMCLNAMDMPKTSFYITAGSALLNILLNILLIPQYGITGAAVASLVTISLNATLAYTMLKSSLHIRIDKKVVLHLLVSVLIMSLALLACVYIFPIRDFVGLMLILGFSAIVYFVSVLGIDRTIRNDLKELLDTMHLPVIS
jgi:O-antigen/teichoic acid export membrane protein